MYVNALQSRQGSAGCTTTSEYSASLAHHEPCIRTCSHSTKSYNPNTHGQARTILRLVLGEKGKWCNKPTRIAKANHPGRSNTALLVSVQIDEIPAYAYDNNGLQPDHSKTDSEISH